MPSLSEMVGQTIAVHIPFIDRVKVQEVKLHAIENGGIWIESQNLTDVMLSNIGASAAPKTLIYFVPFHQITFVWHALDVPSLSETKLGVKA